MKVIMTSKFPKNDVMRERIILVSPENTHVRAEEPDSKRKKVTRQLGKRTATPETSLTQSIKTFGTTISNASGNYENDQFPVQNCHSFSQSPRNALNSSGMYTRANENSEMLSHEQRLSLDSTSVYDAPPVREVDIYPPVVMTSPIDETPNGGFLRDGMNTKNDKDDEYVKYLENELANTKLKLCNLQTEHDHTRKDNTELKNQNRKLSLQLVSARNESSKNLREKLSLQRQMKEKEGSNQHVMNDAGLHIMDNKGETMSDKHVLCKKLHDACENVAYWRQKVIYLNSHLEKLFEQQRYYKIRFGDMEILSRQWDFEKEQFIKAIWEMRVELERLREVIIFKKRKQKKFNNRDEFKDTEGTSSSERRTSFKTFRRGSICFSTINIQDKQKDENETHGALQNSRNEKSIEREGSESFKNEYKLEEGSSDRDSTKSNENPFGQESDEGGNIKIQQIAAASILSWSHETFGRRLSGLNFFCDIDELNLQEFDEALSPNLIPENSEPRDLLSAPANYNDSKKLWQNILQSRLTLPDQALSSTDVEDSSKRNKNNLQKVKKLGSYVDNDVSNHSLLLEGTKLGNNLRNESSKLDEKQNSWMSLGSWLFSNKVYE
mmetsp:Transcript_2741/g.3895  ORF Transcript_2741/g.3895 Transcript_2741/m.3895 type:complete len:609 (-) Transcript_2741:410-2236(-)